MLSNYQIVTDRVAMTLMEVCNHLGGLGSLTHLISLTLILSEQPILHKIIEEKIQGLVNQIANHSLVKEIRTPKW